MSDYLWKSLLTEFIGTFTLVFIGAGAVALTAQQGGSLVGSAFAFGLVLMTIIYTWGTYSGAHVNPAVSFGFALAGRMNWGLMIGYWIAQLLGAIAAGALIAYFFGTENGAGASVGSLTYTDQWKAVLLEAILTFFLVITVLFVTRNPMLAIASGLAIGLVLTFDMLVGAPLTGASMNPARSLGPAIFSNNMSSYWIYVIGPLLGALVAALVYKLYVTNWSCCVKVDECGNKITDECGNTLLECKRPVVDNCGKQVVDCDGPKWETYTTVDRKLGHHQESILSTIGGTMGAYGVDPRYIKQELSHIARDQGLDISQGAVSKSAVDTILHGPNTLSNKAVTPQLSVPGISSQAAAVNLNMQSGVNQMTSQLMSMPQKATSTMSSLPSLPSL